MEGSVPEKSSCPNINRITVNQLIDHSNNKIPDVRAIPTSRNLNPEDSAVEIQLSCELQRSLSSEHRKHGFPGPIEDLGNQSSKRFKASLDSASLPSHSVVMRGDTGKMDTSQLRPGKPGYLSPRDYQLQLMLLEQREKLLRMMARQNHDGDSSMVGSRLGDGPNNLASDRVKRTYQADSFNKGIRSPIRETAVLTQPALNHQPVPAHPPNRRVEHALHAHRERIDNKRVGVESLAKFEAHQKHIEHERDKTMLMMQREVKELDMWLEECQRVIQEKRAQMKLDGRVKSLKGSPAEVIKTLKSLVIQLPDL